MPPPILYKDSNNQLQQKQKRRSILRGSSSKSSSLLGYLWITIAFSMAFSSQRIAVRSFQISQLPQPPVEKANSAKTPFSWDCFLSSKEKDSFGKDDLKFEDLPNPNSNPNRRKLLLQGLTASFIATIPLSITPQPSLAYTPDPDKLQESLYFISRVQEATVQQERFIKKLGGTLALRTKLKLTLRLIDKNYKLLDQINYSSAYITPKDAMVEASEAGYEAVDALQSAIEFVNKDENWKDDSNDKINQERTTFLVQAMTNCREQLLIYTNYMPNDKLTNARRRVEDENISNRDEFDGDDDAGVYNPVNLPWAPILKQTANYKKK